MIVFTLCGLWHGAAWPFIAWGVLHGVWLCLHRAFRAFCAARPRLDGVLLTPPGTALRVAVTLTLFVFTLVVFRSPSLAAGFGMVRDMVVPHGGGRLELRPVSFACLTALVVAGHLLAHNGRWRRLTARVPAPARGLAYAAAMGAALLLAPDSGQAFIYFQF
jgi:alginate O-acetyltransferase complex protein AlgI